MEGVSRRGIAAAAFPRRMGEWCLLPLSLKPILSCTYSVILLLLDPDTPSPPRADYWVTGARYASLPVTRKNERREGIPELGVAIVPQTPFFPRPRYDEVNYASCCWVRRVL